ncbi:serine/threonine-protein kinase [Actinomycetospora atypica]|uniref:non-specific serine/threonine protein kinase n=1 Tax=Actinomycetospora atypica TaxID=1290095 RepID=A0ABV9YQ50_9PSEU
MTAVREAPLIPGFSGLVEIGSGGFATVYRARREAFDQTVAVKVVHLGGAPESVRMRFDRERRALGSLAHHPHIVTVYDGGITASGAPFLVMEYLPDGALEKQAGRLSVAEVLRIGVQLAGALETAHRSNVLHRDVKPANVLRSRYGDPVLADFGIARLAGGSRTTSGVVTASLAYAPPEVLEAKQPGPASDVWSLAATLVCLLTGRPPFAAEVGDAGTPALIARILRDEPPDLVAHGVPADVAVPLLAAMTHDLRRRTGTALKFAESLQAVQKARGETVAPAVVDGTPSQRATPTEQPALADQMPAPRPAPMTSDEHTVHTVPFLRPTSSEGRAATSLRGRRWRRLIGSLLVSALVAAVGVVIIGGVLEAVDDSPSPEATSTPSQTGTQQNESQPPVSRAAPQLSFTGVEAGTWSGRLVSADDGSQLGEDVVITLPKGSNTGQKKSTFYLADGISCTSRVGLISRSEGQLGLSDVPYDPDGACSAIPFSLTPSGNALIYSHEAPDAPGAFATAILTRKF